MSIFRRPRGRRHLHVGILCVDLRLLRARLLVLLEIRLLAVAAAVLHTVALDAGLEGLLRVRLWLLAICALLCLAWRGGAFS